MALEAARRHPVRGAALRIDVEHQSVRLLPDLQFVEVTHDSPSLSRHLVATSLVAHDQMMDSLSVIELSSLV